jgi:hypothetical protein
VGDIAGIVLNSNLEKGTEQVPAEAAKMEAWFRNELERVKLTGVKHIIVFQHISFFLKDPNEEEQYSNIPKSVRERYLRYLHEYGVEHVFAGHYHRNELGRDGDLEMVTSRAGGHAAGRREIRPARGHRQRRCGDAQVLRFRRTAVGQTIAFCGLSRLA